MKLKISSNKAAAFVGQMEALGEKVNDTYIPGKIEDFVKLDFINGQLDLYFAQEVPEFLRVACYQIFVNTIL